MKKGGKMAITVFLAISFIFGVGCDQEEFWRAFQEEAVRQNGETPVMAKLKYSVNFANEIRRALDGQFFNRLYRYRQDLVENFHLLLVNINTGEEKSLIIEANGSTSGETEMLPGDYKITATAKSGSGNIEFVDNIPFFEIRLDQENVLSANLHFAPQIHIPIVVKGVSNTFANGQSVAFSEEPENNGAYDFAAPFIYDNGGFKGNLVLSRPWDSTEINFTVHGLQDLYSAAFNIEEWIDYGFVTFNAAADSVASEVTLSYTYDSLSLSIQRVNWESEASSSVNKIGSFRINNGHVSEALTLISVDAYTDWVVDVKLEIVVNGTTQSFPADKVNIVVNPGQTEFVTVWGRVSENAPSEEQYQLKLNGFDFETNWGEVVRVDEELVFNMNQASVADDDEGEPVEQKEMVQLLYNQELGEYYFQFRNGDTAEFEWPVPESAQHFDHEEFRLIDSIGNQTDGLLLVNKVSFYTASSPSAFEKVFLYTIKNHIVTLVDGVGWKHLGTSTYLTTRIIKLLAHEGRNELLTIAELANQGIPSSFQVKVWDENGVYWQDEVTNPTFDLNCNNWLGSDDVEIRRTANEVCIQYTDSKSNEEKERCFSLGGDSEKPQVVYEENKFYLRFQGRDYFVTDGPFYPEVDVMFLEVLEYDRETIYFRRTYDSKYCPPSYSIWAFSLSDEKTTQLFMFWDGDCAGKTSHGLIAHELKFNPSEAFGVENSYGYLFLKAWIDGENRDWAIADTKQHPWLLKANYVFESVPGGVRLIIKDEENIFEEVFYLKEMEYSVGFQFESADDSDCLDGRQEVNITPENGVETYIKEGVVNQTPLTEPRNLILIQNGVEYDSGVPDWRYGQGAFFNNQEIRLLTLHDEVFLAVKITERTNKFCNFQLFRLSSEGLVEIVKYHANPRVGFYIDQVYFADDLIHVVGTHESIHSQKNCFTEVYDYDGELIM